MTYSEALKLVKSLSKDEQLRLADAIWDDADPDLLPPLTEAQKAELIRRRDAHRADPTRGIPLEDVLAEMRERYPG